MPVLYMESASIDALTEDDIKKIIDKNSAGLKYGKLNDYYIGQHAILNHYKKDKVLPNNKIVNNMAKYITDTSVGYFIGKPITYNSENKEFLELMQDIFDYNDEQDHNMELAKKSSIDGSCFEMLYMDEDAKIRFAKVPAADLIMIYETGFSAPKAAIRRICSKDKNGKSIVKVEYWNSEEVYYFRSEGGGKLELEDIKEHYWKDVPFVEYINNEERIGDFEGVISSIDAYNKVQSNTANYFQYNDEAILTVSKLGDVESKEIAEMKEQGAIILEDGGEVKWLLKVIDDTALENFKNRLKEDIHLGSNTPNMSDESFGGNLSGISISYKLWSLDQASVIKERKFKKGIQRRIELITNILNIQGHHFDYREIEAQFRRNRPQNILELADVVTKLSNDLSRETRLQMLPTVENVQDEIEKLETERSKEIENFGTYKNLAKAFQAENGIKAEEAGSDA